MASVGVTVGTVVPVVPVADCAAKATEGSTTLRGAHVSLRIEPSDVSPEAHRVETHAVVGIVAAKRPVAMWRGVIDARAEMLRREAVGEDGDEGAELDVSLAHSSMGPKLASGGYCGRGRRLGRVRVAGWGPVAAGAVADSVAGAAAGWARAGAAGTGSAARVRDSAVAARAAPADAAVRAGVERAAAATARVATAAGAGLGGGGEGGGSGGDGGSTIKNMSYPPKSGPQLFKSGNLHCQTTIDAPSTIVTDGQARVQTPIGKVRIVVVVKKRSLNFPGGQSHGIQDIPMCGAHG